MRQVIEDLIWQFGYQYVRGGKPIISGGCCSALKAAFKAIKWHDPHVLTKQERERRCCEIQGCFERIGGAVLIERTRVNLCTSHMEAREKGRPLPPIKRHAIRRRESY